MFQIHFDHRVGLWVVLRGSERLLQTKSRDEAVTHYRKVLRGEA